MNKVTVVTAWYYINNKYTLNQYIEWFKCFLSLNINLVIYTNEESKKQIEHLRSDEKENTVYILRNFEDFKVYEFIDYWNYCEQIDIEKKWGAGHNKYLYMIWNERHYHWIHEITELNPFKSDYFVWTDIGIIREADMTPLLKGFPNSILNYPQNKFLLSQVSSLEQGDNLMDLNGILLRNKNINSFTSCQPYNRIQGGFFAGYIDSCKKYSDLYKIELQRFIKSKDFAGKDQNVLFNLLIQNKDINFIELLPQDNNSWKPNHWASCLINISRVPLFSTKIQGGLGNQMFQVALAIAAALEYGGKAVFLNEKLNGIEGNTDRPTYWNSVFRKCSVYERLDDSLNGSFIDLHEFHTHTYTPVVESIKNYIDNKVIKNFRFVGYFQSSRYFNKYKNEIKELFEPSKAVKNWCENKLKEWEKNDKFSDESNIKVAIHIRRTDYVKLGWNLLLEYYLKSIEQVETKLNEKYNNIQFIIFSDDIEWCKENFKSVKNVSFCQEGSDIEQMYLISKMNGMICSNSSFSWWSTYLSDTHEIVTVPERWFINQSYNPDIYEPNWIKIKN